MFLTLILISVVVCLIVLYLWTTSSAYDYFKRHGIPGPPHQFFFGHYKEFWRTKSFSTMIQQWTKQYGSVYGLFMGTKPMYVVSDVDFIQEVYIKQFSSFHTRLIPSILRVRTDSNIHLFRATGDSWRRQRHIINPTFSSRKLKLMSSLVDGCIDALLKKLSEEVKNEHTEINIYEMYKRLTMDVICRCAFGIDTDMQNDSNNMYLRKSAEVFKVDIEQMLPFKICSVMPIFARPIHDVMFGIQHIQKAFAHSIPILNNLTPFPAQWLLQRLDEVLQLRYQSMSYPQKRIDLLQLMIDAAHDTKTSNETEGNGESKVLKHSEIIPNIFLFMIAGYETTSTALAYSTYILATHLDIQRQLFSEIDQHHIDHNDHDAVYDTAMNLTYLDLFVREVLRMYPITSKAMARECNTTTTICGHTIEEGSIIQPDVFTIHYNPELWGPEDPNIFYPERHAEKRHPAAWMPFGIGPRSCIGIRFALMELKMCLIRLLGEYEILASDRIEEGFRREERLVIQPDAIFVKLRKRSS
ncbi:unnamed protein product [Adineta ricciae]|uniref:Cytochrome P450 n=1 Tax=Adineta ricciae TaxID=249248 RepID=A0A813UF25_ADIRI|nr:unnamed protein product [Adineta ricciae]